MTSTSSSVYIHSAMRSRHSASWYPSKPSSSSGAMSDGHDLDVGPGGLGALLEPGAELLDEGAGVGADVADPSGRRLEGRRRPDEERALLVGEAHADPVRDLAAGRSSRGTPTSCPDGQRRRRPCCPTSGRCRTRGRRPPPASAWVSLDARVRRFEHHGLEPVLLGRLLDPAGHELVEPALVRGRTASATEIRRAGPSVGEDRIGDDAGEERDGREQGDELPAGPAAQPWAVTSLALVDAPRPRAARDRLVEERALAVR